MGTLGKIVICDLNTITNETSTQNEEITYLLLSSRFLIASCGTQLLIYERNLVDVNLQKSYFELVMTITPKYGSLSANEENILLVPSDTSCLILNITNLEQEAKRKPKLLFPPAPNASIIDMDVPVRKSFVAALGSDRTVRIYNFLNHSCEIFKDFADEPLCMSVHPSGFYMLLGFPDRLRMMRILSDDIRTDREFPLRNCKKCAFSNGGHVFAAAQGSVVYLFNTWTYEPITILKGHNGKVTSILWNKSDTHVVTSGSDGAVYSWNVKESKRDNEYIIKGVSYSSACLCNGLIYATGSDKSLRIIADSMVQMELFSQTEHSQIVLSNCGTMMFGGTVTGSVKAFKFPFLPGTTELDSAEVAQHNQLHAAKITRMRITYDDKYIFSASEDGCITAFRVSSRQDKPVIDDIFLSEAVGEMYATEVLAAKPELNEQKTMLQELKTRKEELALEHDYQIRLKDLFLQTRIKEISGEMSKLVDQNKMIMGTLKGEKEKGELRFKDVIKMEIEKNKQSIIDVENKNNDELVEKYEKYEVFQQNLKKKMTEWEQDVKNQQQYHQREIEQHSEAQRVMLEKKDLEVVKHREEIDKSMRINAEIQRQVCEEIDMEITMLTDEYEASMIKEQQVNFYLKGENGVMKKKFMALTKEIEECNLEMTKLKESEVRLKKVMASLEREVESLKIVILERDKTIQEQEKRAHELKKENQEREKGKFVLDFKIKDLKKQIEPKEKIIADHLLRIQKIGDQLSEMSIQRTKNKKTIQKLKNLLEFNSNELTESHQKQKTKAQQIQMLQTEVTFAMDYFQEPFLLRRSVMNIHQKHCKEMKPNEPQKPTDAQLEFQRQERNMRRQIKELKIQLRKQRVENRNVHYKWVQENRGLISEAQRMRKDVYC